MFDYKTPDWMNKSITLSLEKDQNLPRDMMLIQQTIIRRCYSIS